MQEFFANVRNQKLLTAKIAKKNRKGREKSNI